MKKKILIAVVIGVIIYAALTALGIYLWAFHLL